ncbi:MAG: T9SS type A sorting domain-containing protein [Chitinophagales bacterium]|nr:T9SS type A sorting domain-containing protein [Chitinophagales bacterium]
MKQLWILLLIAAPLVSYSQIQNAPETVSVFELTPTPTEDYLNINYLLEDPATATIITLRGMVVAQFPVELGWQKVDVSGLQRGVYLFFVRNQSGKVLGRQMIYIQ